MEDLQTALAITRQMLSFSKAGNWEKVIDAQQQRDEILHHVVPDNIDSASSETVRVLQELLDINTKISDSANLEKERSLQSYVSLKHGKKAVQAYR